MDFLVTLQYTCFMFAALLATILIVFSFFQNEQRESIVWRAVCSSRR